MERRKARQKCAWQPMFYELKHSLAADYCKVESGCDFSFPAHMHHCFEWITVTEGKMRVTVGEREYLLFAGESVLVFPNQIHAMESAPQSQHFLCLFSPRLVQAYTEKTAGRIPVDNRFLDTRWSKEALEEAADTNPILLKGILYTICGTFDHTAQYRTAGSNTELLLYRIFLFVEENYHADASLTALSHTLGYDYAYLSKYFHGAAGMTYNEYLRQYRISRACYLLENEKMTILAIAVECGFGSLRSMNRQFRAQMGQTPTEYRRTWRNKASEAEGHMESNVR